MGRPPNPNKPISVTVQVPQPVYAQLEELKVQGLMGMTIQAVLLSLVGDRIEELIESNLVNSRKPDLKK